MIKILLIWYLGIQYFQAASSRWKSHKCFSSLEGLEGLKQLYFDFTRLMLHNLGTSYRLRFLTATLH